MISHHDLPRKKRKFWRWILLIVIIVLIKFCFFGGSLDLHETVVIQKGDTFQKFADELSTSTKFKLKLYLFTHKKFDLGKIQEGSYVLSGNYSFGQLLTQIMEWPTQSYIRYTILEGRSIYDIDEDLVKKWYAASGEFVKYVSDYGTISELMQWFEFLRQFNLGTLEWFLYPDTYHIDVNTPFVKQLVLQQLRNFEKKIRSGMSAQLINFKNTLNLKGIRLGLDMTPYQILTLASVIEKEEKAATNKPTVAGIFLKRLSIGMRLDADITLCYGLKTGYETCTPAFIAKNIDDKNNPYNTRQKGWLPPTPITSPTVSSVDAVLNFVASDYLFYLHDMDGKIHYGRTSAEHSANKNAYLK